MTKIVQHGKWSSGIRRRGASAALTLVVALTLGILTSQPVQAQTYKETVLYTFTGGADGANSDAGLIFDAKGNLYGTTVFGGASNFGVVFKVNSKGKETVLHTFTGGSDGGYPLYSGLIFDAKGNLYGTTEVGGAYNRGVVFKVSSKAKETVLYTFTGGADGSSPVAGLIFDAEGNLYGTTYFGGAYNHGVVFKVDSKGKETVLYSFTGEADGGYPNAGLIFDAKGNLYSTTGAGGSSNAGTVFKVSKGKETVLYSFTGGADGAYPQAGLIFDAKGNLYGTTESGGASGSGTVFELNKKGVETVLYSFTGGAHGKFPIAGVVMDAKGNLYGTTFLGGASNAGVVFKVTSKGKETVLHTFTDGADGGRPAGGLIFDVSGNLYGTTSLGGTSSAGVVFKVSGKGQKDGAF